MHFRGNVEKYDRTRHASSDNIIGRMRFAGWTRKAIDTQSEYVTLKFFHYNNGCMNAPQCYVIRTLSVLYYINSTKRDNVSIR